MHIKKRKFNVFFVGNVPIFNHVPLQTYNTRPHPHFFSPCVSIFLHSDIFYCTFRFMKLPISFCYKKVCFPKPEYVLFGYLLLQNAQSLYLILAFFITSITLTTMVLHSMFSRYLYLTRSFFNGEGNNFVTSHYFCNAYAK